MEWQAREEHLKECEENHIIEPASNSSKFSIAWVIAAKKDLQGEWTDKRCCLDARRLNAMSVDNNYRTHTLDQIASQEWKEQNTSAAWMPNQDTIKYI